MKRIALLLCLLCVFGKGHALVIINASINFGAKKYGCEKGVGICLLQVDSRNQSQESAVQISLSPEKRNIQIDFPREITTLLPQQFRGHTFVQEEDYEVPEDILKALGVHSSLTIPSGSYSLEDLGDRMRLTLPIDR